ncbi:hypothetical protein SAMN05518672_11717 [Chitinophaga sp. CF118]|nr:hypothetical protein SAMN05518672_11717 [Chitinophaga sp. CF118]
MINRDVNILKTNYPTGKKYRPGKNPARLKVTTKSKPAYEKV